MVCVCVRGVAGEPAQIKCSLSGSTKVKLGQKVDGDIQVNVKDKHGNEIKKVRGDNDVLAEWRLVLVDVTELKLKHAVLFILKHAVLGILLSAGLAVSANQAADAVIVGWNSKCTFFHCCWITDYVISSSSGLVRHPLHWLSIAEQLIEKK